METLLKTILINFYRFFSKISLTLTAEIAWSFFCKPRIQKKPLRELEKELLQQAKQYFIDSGEYKISVYEWKNSSNANGSKAKTILLTHGWGGHALNFSHLIIKLLEGNFNVIAYDSPAHGKSSGKKTNLLHNTQALLDVSQHTKSVDALIGHSFGTMANAYALELTKETSHLSAVKKIILIAGPNKLVDIFASFTQAMQLPNSILAIFHQKLEAIAKRKTESMSVVEFLQRYTGESLVVHDHKDRVVPFSEAATVANGIAATSLLATTGFGHFRVLSAASVIDTIFNFLSTNTEKHS